MIVRTILRRSPIAAAVALLGLFFAVRPAVPAPPGATLQDFGWKEAGSDELAFNIEFDAAVRPKSNDKLFSNKYWYIDFYGASGPLDVKDWVVDRIGFRQVKRVYYPQPGVLRLIFYVEDGLSSRFELAGSGKSYQVVYRQSKTDTLGGRDRFEPHTGGKLVIIDPGHGGHSTGAQTSRAIDGRQYWEKDIVLEIARKMLPLFESSPNLQVRLTRTRDVYVSLEDRIRQADAAKADLFVSIHLNATDSRRKDARGFEIYYLSDGKKETNRQLEDLENDRHIQLDEKVSGGENLRAILSDLADEMFVRRREESFEVCQVINHVFTQKGPFVGENRGVKAAGFRVLMNYNMPAVLAECGFIDNDAEARRLILPDTQKQIATLLFNAINLYFARKDPAFEAHLAKVP